MVAMEIDTKFLRLFKPSALGDHIDGWRVCRMGVGASAGSFSSRRWKGDGHFVDLDAAVKPDCWCQRPVSHKSIIGPLYSNANPVEGESYRIK